MSGPDCFKLLKGSVVVPVVWRGMVVEGAMMCQALSAYLLKGRVWYGCVG
jgi:hypothetical protein